MTSTTDDLRDEVRSRYAAAATTVAAGGMGCCGSEPSCCGSGDTCNDDRFGPALYALDERAAAPDRAFLASLGCGNPTAVAELREGETVLDLGSGGGLDVILSARRVGETGVADDHLTQADRERRGSFVGCIAGALSFAEYDELLRGAGFEQISVGATHQVADGMHGAIVRAVLPTTTTAKEV